VDWEKEFLDPSMRINHRKDSFIKGTLKNSFFQTNEPTANGHE
jgi:hypothetical protein